MGIKVISEKSYLDLYELCWGLIFRPESINLVAAGEALKELDRHINKNIGEVLKSLGGAETAADRRREDLDLAISAAVRRRLGKKEYREKMVEYFKIIDVSNY